MFLGFVVIVTLLCTSATVNGDDDAINWDTVQSGQINFGISKPIDKTSNTVRNSIGRIYNGTTVGKIEDFPYQVGIIQNHKDGYQTWCGGSIISSTYILTAGHCLWDIVRATVHMGILSRRNPGPHLVKMSVTKEQMYIHKGFDHIENYNDLALIRLNTPIVFNDYIQPIDLISLKDANEIDGKTAITSGWGLTSDREPGVHDTLQYNKVKIVSDSDCQQQFYSFGLPIALMESKTFICGDDKEKSGVCEGDSGGAAVTNINGKRTQVGVNAFVVYDSSSKCDHVYGRVFTRVSQFLDWICEHSQVCA